MRIAILAILLAACGDPMPEPTPDATPAPLCSSIPGCDAAHLTCTGTACECRPELAPSSQPIACLGG